MTTEPEQAGIGDEEALERLSITAPTMDAPTDGTPSSGGRATDMPSSGGRAAEAPSPAVARPDSADSSLPDASRSWAAADSLQTFAAMFEAMADAVFIVDQHGALAYTNAAAAGLLGEGERAALVQGADTTATPERHEQPPAPCAPSCGACLTARP